jgi:RNA polymerase sigma-70 factor (ECF subfamily)
MHSAKAETPPPGPGARSPLTPPPGRRPPRSKVPSRLCQEAIARAHLQALYQRAYWLTRDASEAWDLVQDTFERCLRALPERLEAEKVRAWLFVILRNLFLDRCRSHERRARVPTEDAFLLEVPTPETEEVPVWMSLDPQEVRRCVQRLDPALRQVHELRVERGLSQAEIAGRLGIPLATVGTRLFRARKHLRRLLDAHLAAETAPAPQA